MARVSPIDETTHPEVAALAADIRKLRSGNLSHLYGTLLNSPPVAAGWLKLLTAVRWETKLAGNYRELVILLIAVINGADYEYDSHIPHALKEGVTQRQVDALRTWRESDAFDAKTRAVLAYTEAMTRDVHVADDVFAAIREHFDTRGIVELTALIASYNLVSRFLVALKVGET
jgi:alkylhydroperoxidase family enzyme